MARRRGSKSLIVVIVVLVIWIANRHFPKPSSVRGQTQTQSAAPRFAQGEEFSGQVVAVYDGDTIAVLLDHVQVKIRLYGIDCPEKDQPYGKQAKKFAADAVFKKNVRVVVKDTDRYGRVVGEVFLPDGSCLNHNLLSAGHAWWYRHFAKDELFEQLEGKARKGKIGLWAAPHPLPPWEFRKEKMEAAGRAQ